MLSIRVAPLTLSEPDRPTLEVLGAVLDDGSGLTRRSGMCCCAVEQRSNSEIGACRRQPSDDAVVARPVRSGSRVDPAMTAPKCRVVAHFELPPRQSLLPGHRAIRRVR